MPPDPNIPSWPVTNDPWDWGSFAGIPGKFSCNTNKIVTPQYIDTIMLFYAPRTCFALGLQGCIDQILAQQEPAASGIRLLATVSDVQKEVFQFHRRSLPAGQYVLKVSFREGFASWIVVFD